MVYRLGLEVTKSVADYINRVCYIIGNNVNENISLAQFDFNVVFGNDYATDYYDLAYPGVILRIYLERKIWFHLMQTYIPAFIFVTLAWLTCFIPSEQVPGMKYEIQYKIMSFTYLTVSLFNKQAVHLL